MTRVGDWKRSYADWLERVRSDFVQLRTACLFDRDMRRLRYLLNHHGDLQPEHRISLAIIRLHWFRDKGVQREHNRRVIRTLHNLYCGTLLK